MSNTVARKIKGRFVYEETPGIVFNSNNPKSVSRTQQHFKQEADINYIMARYAKTGVLVDPLKVVNRKPQFGDFTNVSDFMTAQNKVIEVNSYFDRLPAKIRLMFNNNVNELLLFLSKDENLAEAEKLGLVERDLSKVKYVDKDGNDITDKVIAERGIFVNGKLVKGGESKKSTDDKTGDGSDQKTT